MIALVNYLVFQYCAVTKKLLAQNVHYACKMKTF